MSLQPQGDALRRAVHWISEQRVHGGGQQERALIEAACLKFDLSPTDASALEHLLLTGEGPRDA